jgi:transketolase
VLDRTVLASASGLARGAYVLVESGRFTPEVILIAAGSEVALALEAHSRLAGQGIRSRVVSMPCWELFERQPQSYRDMVLPPSVRARVSIEAAAPFGWERYVGLEGAIIGATDFGASAPGTHGHARVRFHAGACRRDRQKSSETRISVDSRPILSPFPKLEYASRWKEQTSPSYRLQNPTMRPPATSSPCGHQ